MKFLVLCILFLTACNFNHIKDENAQQPKGSGVTSNSFSLDYISVQANVIGPQCLRCHSTAGGNQGGLTIETYAQVRANLNKIYFRAVEKKDMPANSLPAPQLELLKAWIDSGAPEKSIGKNTGPIKGPITWNVIKKQVLGSSCLDCHSGQNADGGLNFEDMEVVRKNITAIFESAIVKQTMPLQPYPALNDGEKQALMKWISQGMPN